MTLSIWTRSRVARLAIAHKFEYIDSDEYIRRHLLMNKYTDILKT